jgi:hypothetical protein
MKSRFGVGEEWASSLTTLRPRPALAWEEVSHSRCGDRSTPLGMTETMGVWGGLGDYDVRVLDPDTGESLPDGPDGEFLIRGHSLMQGLYKKEREEVLLQMGSIGLAIQGISNKAGPISRAGSRK